MYIGGVFVIDNNLRIINNLQKNIDEGTLLHNALPVLKENAERIEFFKLSSDYNKPMIEKNFLVLLEKSTDYIISLLGSEQGDTDSELGVLNNIDLTGRPLADLNKALEKDLNNFFKNTNETLYVSISFETQLVTNKENWELYEMMEDTGYSKSELLKAVLDKTKYPEWYDPMYEEDLDRITTLFSTLRKYNNKKMSLYIEDIDKELKESLLNKDFEKAKKLVEMMDSAGDSFEKEKIMK